MQYPSKFQHASQISKGQFSFLYETQKTRIAKTILNNKRTIRCIIILNLQLYYRTIHSNKNSTVLAQKQTGWSMESKRRPKHMNAVWMKFPNDGETESQQNEACSTGNGLHPTNCWSKGSNGNPQTTHKLMAQPCCWRQHSSLNTKKLSWSVWQALRFSLSGRRRCPLGYHKRNRHQPSPKPFDLQWRSAYNVCWGHRGTKLVGSN